MNRAFQRLVVRSRPLGNHARKYLRTVEKHGERLLTCLDRAGELGRIHTDRCAPSLPDDFDRVAAAGSDESETLILLLGITLCTYCAVTFLRIEMPPPGKREPRLSPVMGGTGGLMFGMTGIMIVPGILYLQTLGLRRDVFVQALGLTFITITLALGTSLTGRGLMTQDLAWMSLAALVPTAGGLALGQRYRHHISEERFKRIFFVALFLIGLDMLRRTLL